MKRQLAERMGEDAHYLEGRDKAFLAELAGIPVEQIEDDEIITGEGETGWIEERETNLDLADRMRMEVKEEIEKQRQRTIERGSLGGSYRIAAALARKGGKA
ncbi:MULTISPECIES: hypothetical protein [Aeromonas]|uniref:hypothetical protein n=1 Tax=Aeromonas TaxID=642 RepID=UPI00114CBEC6|nr:MULTISPECIES: hypothetical protein [Aeromonas]MCF5885295.1 hypothetical protein [Aeromonas veronii]MCR3938279.1 hypothetical protein [Aeromonas caviae]MCR3945361.1 hypothetical protein [Aeromonas caviae]MDX7835505.1 hypothetical protein [Aeromonas caviae]MEA9443646.1 hypothetical protein [Aeromonas caviae]